MNNTLQKVEKIINWNIEVNIPISNSRFIVEAVNNPSITDIVLIIEMGKFLSLRKILTNPTITIFGINTNIIKKDNAKIVNISEY